MECRMQQGVPAREPGLYATADRVMRWMSENFTSWDAVQGEPGQPGFGAFAAWVLRCMSGDGMPQGTSPEPDFDLLPVDRS